MNWVVLMWLGVAALCIHYVIRMVIDWVLLVYVFRPSLPPISVFIVVAAYIVFETCVAAFAILKAWDAHTQGG